MASPFGITVIEDNEAMLDVTTLALQQAGYRVRGMCHTDAFDEHTAEPVDIVIIDLNLPGESGLSFARRLRAAQPRIGIIMVTARATAADRVAGYHSGADIYLTKPTSMDELLSAVQALANRISGATFTSEQPRLNPRAMQLEFNQQSAKLSDVETRILTALARAAGQRLEHWQLLEIAGLELDDLGKAALEVRMARLRKKLRQAGLPAQAIRPIRNVGYQLCANLQLI